jgi:hypothetical protein
MLRLARSLVNKYLCSETASRSQPLMNHRPVGEGDWCARGALDPANINSSSYIDHRSIRN